jgi:Zn-finger nucleic acid-binding protein
MEQATRMCPVCNKPLHSRSRNGITIDQCTDCGGVWLDRGELEHIIDRTYRHRAAGYTDEIDIQEWLWQDVDPNHRRG